MKWPFVIFASLFSIWQLFQWNMKNNKNDESPETNGKKENNNNNNSLSWFEQISDSKTKIAFLLFKIFDQFLSKWKCIIDFSKWYTKNSLCFVFTLLLKDRETNRFVISGSLAFFTFNFRAVCRKNCSIDPRYEWY